jgi:hypothetical protein
MTKQSVPIPDIKKEKLLDRFLRFGLIAKGVVYCLFGIVAVLAAFGLSREKASKTEALKLIYEQPFGQVILVVILIGIAGYVTLRVFQSFKDIDQKGNDLRGIFTRVGYGISALIYAGLGIFIVRLLMNDSSGGDANAKIISEIFSWTGGQTLVGAVACIIILNGIRQIYKGASRSFLKNVALIKSNFEGFFSKTGVLGYVARGTVLVIIGYLFLHASVTANPDETKGSEQAFAFIENKFGTLLMGIIAFGLIAYGFFMFVKAKYQRLRIEPK